MLLMVAAMTALLVVFVWTSLDPTHDDPPPVNQPLIELSAH
jgi:hypothetical protein